MALTSVRMRTESAFDNQLTNHHDPRRHHRHHRQLRTRGLRLEALCLTVMQTSWELIIIIAFYSQAMRAAGAV